MADKANVVLAKLMNNQRLQSGEAVDKRDGAV